MFLPYTTNWKNKSDGIVNPIFIVLNLLFLYKYNGGVDDSAISFEGDVQMWPGGTTSGANIGDWLAGEDF